MLRITSRVAEGQVTKRTPQFIAGYIIQNMEIAIMNYTAPNNDLQYTCVHNATTEETILEI
jgi:hypothetical protein